MPVLDNLERRFGKFAIPGLIRYVVALNALVFLLYLLQWNVGIFQFDRDAIAAGQIWRAFTWIFIPTTTSLLWIIFYLMFTWWIGDCLEATWGTFRLNVYYFLGFSGCVASGLIFGAAGGNSMLTLTLLLAAATLAPNLEVLLFGIIPLKLKWIAAIGLIFPVMVVLGGGLAGAAIVILCLGNYLLFFGPSLLRQARTNHESGIRRAKFQQNSRPESEALHRCEACGRTELSNPDLDFRVSSDGHEYCSEHLPARARS